MSGSPAINSGGPLTALTSPVGDVGSSFTVNDSAAIAPFAGANVLDIDGEAILVNFDPTNGFTVVQPRL